jgi:hypothetical protein
MSIFGGILLYLGSLIMLLAVAIIAAGSFLSDPGRPAGPSVTSQVAPPSLAGAKDSKAGPKGKQGAKDVAASAAIKKARQKRTAASRIRPAASRPANADSAASAFGYAPETRPSLFLPDRR